MPAVYKSLVSEGLSSHKAWRVAFIVPGILIVSVAIALVVLCPDTPTGKWSERTQAAESNLRQHSVSGAIVDIPGNVTAERKDSTGGAGNESPSGVSDEEKKLDNTRGTFDDHEIPLGEKAMVDTARGEIIQKPSFKEMAKVIFSPQTLVTGACYFGTFGAELSINSILGKYFQKNFKYLGLSGSGDWAAMFGLMNIVARPLGGLVSDFAYHFFKSVWAKKILLHTYSFITGAFLIALGVTNPKNLGAMVGLVNVGAAFFLEGANGLNYSLVPHVHPHANGVVSGFTGACGNFGGIIFSVIFLEVGDYATSVWAIGIFIMGINALVCWIPPIPKGQIGGRYEK